MSLAERSRRAVWHPCTQMKRHEREPLLAIARAEGPWLFPSPRPAGSYPGELVCVVQQRQKGASRDV